MNAWGLACVTTTPTRANTLERLDARTRSTTMTMMTMRAMTLASALSRMTTTTNNNNKDGRQRRGDAVTMAASKKKKKAEAKQAAAATKKMDPKQAKAARDKARKAAATKARGLVSDQGRAYEKIVNEMGRESSREYVLSIRHAPKEADAAPIAVLSDWLPICEVVVADRKAYEAGLFFKKQGMAVPETELQALENAQVEGVPAVRMMLPKYEDQVAAMAFVMAGVKDLNMQEVEYGLEDWGSFEVAVDALAAQTNQKGKFDAAANLLGVSVDDEPGDIKRVYRKLIAEAHPDRNPDTTQEKFNAIKDAYELLCGRGDTAGATFEGLGDHRRDFVSLDKAHFGVTSQTKGQNDPASVAFAMRTLTIYDRVGTVFSTRNLKLSQKTAATAKA